MNLVIVESPAKSNTIKKFLGKEYQVAATLGHVRDLPSSKLGVEPEKNFKPHYITIRGKGKVIKNLKKLESKASRVLLAMDPDREGEAIAWHTAKALGLGEKYQRITFNEITKEAVQEALKNPRKIDPNLVDAQQARRILDRLVGYKLSPFLWKKISKGLSAGRVQSAALKLIVEREKEREAFSPQEYWTIKAFLNKEGKGSKSFTALLSDKNGKKLEKFALKNNKDAETIVKDLEKAPYQVLEIEKKENSRFPLAPFTTSTLQQDAWKRFGWSANATMRTAQQLYEKGLITYHRSDSVNVAEQALVKAKKVILEQFGPNYCLNKPKRFKTSAKSAQEAHEAVRPAYPENLPQKMGGLEARQLKLYQLIWQRFIASQMKPAVFDATKIVISAEGKQDVYLFNSSGQILKFDGFLRVYPLKFKEEELPLLKKGDCLKCNKLEPKQHFTQPPARYNEASLIKELEKNGIGRPSTYAPIISLIQKRNYVEKDEQKRFYPAEIGRLVSDLLSENFPEIVDIGFTAEMEEKLDKIAEGKKEWTMVLKTFYEPFIKRLREKDKEVEKHVETTDKICPECGAPLIIKYGRYGKFYGCSTFPNCKYTGNLESKKLNLKCPKCRKGEIVAKRTKRGKVFYGCSRWPQCDFAVWDEPTDKTCPECGWLLTKKGKKLKCSNSDCDFKKINES